MAFWLLAAGIALLIDLAALVWGRQERDTWECWAFWCGMLGLLAGLLAPLLFLYGIGALFTADATRHKVLIADLVLFGMFSLGAAVALSASFFRGGNARHGHD